MTAPADPHQPGQYAPPSPPAERRRRPRIFVWVFAAVQAVFIGWIIYTLTRDVSAGCDPEYISQANCDAVTSFGRFLGTMVILGIWAMVTIILGVGYLVFRQASRR